MKRVVLAAVLMAVLFAAGCGRAPDLRGEAPGFNLPSLSTGKIVNFPQDFSGHPVALIFFSPG